MHLHCCAEALPMTHEYVMLALVPSHRYRYRNRPLHTRKTDCDCDCTPDTDTDSFGLLLLFSERVVPLLPYNDLYELNELLQVVKIDGLDEAPGIGYRNGKGAHVSAGTERADLGRSARRRGSETDF